MSRDFLNQEQSFLDDTDKHLPRHIAVIMDGNGRWAQQRGLPRIEGHRRGSQAVRPTVIEAVRLGIECLTLYSFSIENWKRPSQEVETLMDLYRQYLISERPIVMENNVIVRHLGDIDTLPERVAQELRQTVRLSQNNTGMTLCLALNYSGRSELLRAIQNIAARVRRGELEGENIDEAVVDSHLDTAGLPDPDLLIRTAGENRISNFLLWQISYAELFITDIFWPEFTPAVLRQALADYAGRNRRFGGLKPHRS